MRIAFIFCLLFLAAAAGAQSADSQAKETQAVSSDPMAAAAAREAQLREELAAAQEIELAGVVSASGAAGVQSKGERGWTLLFSLERWRIGDGPIETRTLTVRRTVAAEELKSFQSRLQPYGIVRLKARVDIDTVFGSPQALLTELIGPENDDAELRAQAAALQKPVTKTDSILGTFTLERRLDWFVTEVTKSGKRFELRLDAKTDAEFSAALAHAHQLWKAIDSWDDKARQRAAQDLLALKNDVWRDEGERPLDAKQFMQRMTLESITIRPDGSFELWYGDGDLFWGHSIRVEASVTDRATRAAIEG